MEKGGAKVKEKEDTGKKEGVPDKKSPEYSRGRLSKALGQLGFWEFGRGGLGEGWDKGGSVYKQPETEVDNSCHS